MWLQFPEPTHTVLEQEGIGCFTARVSLWTVFWSCEVMTPRNQSKILPDRHKTPRRWAGGRNQERLTIAPLQCSFRSIYLAVSSGRPAQSQSPSHRPDVSWCRAILITQTSAAADLVQWDYLTVFGQSQWLAHPTPANQYLEPLDLS